MSALIGFSIVIAVVFVVSLIMKVFKQPLIIGYILSGIIVGPLFLNLLSSNNDFITIFSELGIAFLLFLVGLHLSPKVIKEVGKVSLVTGIGQIAFTSLITYFLSLLLGFSVITSLYISIALSFSSTIIIMKLLSDCDALEKLYGKISVGFLLVQDFVAIIILMFISSFSSGNSSVGLLILTFAKGLVVAALLFPISIFVVPFFSKFFARSQEFLFIFAITWGLGLASLFSYFGFSLEVGALIAGVALSISPYSPEISSRLKPLRDFFIISFFLVLGSQMVFANISSLLIPALILSLFILIGNPLIVITLMGVLGYSRKTGFMAGLTVAQISEFSLILIALGVKVGHLSTEILSFITLIGLVTIAGSSYMIIYSEKLFLLVSPLLKVFEKRRIIDREISDKHYDYILLGYNRIGFSILKAFDKITKKYLVVDYDPDTVKILNNQGVNCVYGDVEDSELLDDLGIKHSSVIVSTIPDKDVGELLLNKFRGFKIRPVIIVTARQISDALELYRLGADYVIMPHFLGGEYTSKLIMKARNNHKIYTNERSKEIDDLKERVIRGHEHPNDKV
ncbi:sodium:proton exchanger [Candidatus Pacearchaeota archaeon CG10_big_fil_rev_8_21_14_0_10_35_13]|nr:MAG: sodium:proton exchanger [Candidatus Pacearchaeota archaeon CG10_big_fil_rev_8_21_14_0_10_35_13]